MPHNVHLQHVCSCHYYVVLLHCGADRGHKLHAWPAATLHYYSTTKCIFFRHMCWAVRARFNFSQPPPLREDLYYKLIERKSRLSFHLPTSLLACKLLRHDSSRRRRREPKQTQRKRGGGSSCVCTRLSTTK